MVCNCSLFPESPWSIWKQYFYSGLKLIIKPNCRGVECFYVWVCVEDRSDFRGDIAISLPPSHPPLAFFTADQCHGPYCFISHLFLCCFLPSFFSQYLILILLFFLSFSDVVSSKRGDAESFIPPWKTETGGVYRDRGAISRKTFSLCRR